MTSRGINAQAPVGASWTGRYPKEILHRVRLSRGLWVRGHHLEGDEGPGTPGWGWRGVGEGLRLRVGRLALLALVGRRGWGLKNMRVYLINGWQMLVSF